MDFIPLLIAALGGGTVGVVIKYFFDRPLIKAQVEKIISETHESEKKAENTEALTDKLRGEIVDQLRTQLGEQNKALVAQNKQLLSDNEALGVRIKNLEVANEEKDKAYEKDAERWRKGYGSLEKRIEGMEEDLRTERAEKSRLFRQLSDTKAAYENSIANYVTEIESLKHALKIHNVQIKKLETGRLPPREELGSNITE